MDDALISSFMDEIGLGDDAAAAVVESSVAWAMASAAVKVEMTLRPVDELLVEPASAAGSLHASLTTDVFALLCVTLCDPAHPSSIVGLAGTCKAMRATLATVAARLKESQLLHRMMRCDPGGNRGESRVKHMLHVVAT